MKIKKVPTSESKFQFHFHCPGCEQEHAFNDEVWEWNQDYNNPTLSPSFLIYGYRFDKNGKSVSFRCHSYITEGKIQFLSDCTHSLKDQIVDLPTL